MLAKEQELHFKASPPSSTSTAISTTSNKYRNKVLQTSMSEARKLCSLMNNLDLLNLPCTSELHQSHTDFMRFMHKLFSNVSNSIRNGMQKAQEAVPPDCDEEGGEWDSCLFSEFSFKNLPSVLLITFYRWWCGPKWGDATPRYSSARKPSPAPSKVRFDASVAGGTLHFPKGWRTLNLPYILYKVEVIEGVSGCVKFQEICVWLLSGSIAKPPIVQLSPNYMTVIVEYPSTHFFKPKFLLSNKSNHNPSRYTLWRNCC